MKILFIILLVAFGLGSTFADDNKCDPTCLEGDLMCEPCMIVVSR